jgi:hypothetical protein
MRRKDIHIQVYSDGSIWVAQGNPALMALHARAEPTADSDCIYYSQYRHRAAWRDDEGRPVIGWPRDAPRDGRQVYEFRGLPKCTGEPVHLATLRGT